LGYNFEYFNPTKISFGRGIIESIGDKVKSYGRKALIVTTGKFFRESGLIDRIHNILKRSNIDSEVFTEVSPNPLTTEVDEGAIFGRKKDCDIVIGLGGGSSIDAAKAIAIAMGHNKPIWKFYPGSKEPEEVVTSKTLPIIAVTTTSGTGSHVTCFSVLTNPDNKEKPGLGNEYLFPKVSIVDPELMLTVPTKITAATGFDVLAHAIEAYTSNIATPITDLYCEEALRLVAKYLRTAVKDGSDIETREKMALADTLAGMAITVAVITLCHSISHVVCGICNLVHGESLAAMTPHTIRFSMHENPQRFAKIGLLLSGSDILNQDYDISDVSLENTIKAVKKIIKDIGLDVSLSKQGVKKEDIPVIARGTVGYMSNGVALDLRTASEKDVVDILEKSL
jgi:alcohol dehydrogenase